MGVFPLTSSCAAAGSKKTIESGELKVVHVNIDRITAFLAFAVVETAFACSFSLHVLRWWRAVLSDSRGGRPYKPILLLVVVLFVIPARLVSSRLRLWPPNDIQAWQVLPRSQRQAARR